MKACLLVFIGLFLLFALVLYLSQGRLIYFPQRYYSGKEELSRVDRVSYELNGKKQHAYLLKRDSADLPDRVWWLFGGNGSVALGWVGLVEAVPASKNRAFVLFDYPGYGLNQGSPNPQRIFDSIDLAVPAVAGKLGLSEGELVSRSATVGHSLGAAVAFDFANRYKLSRVVAISPFTTMTEMAKRQVGPVLGLFVSHQYDNEKSMDGILAENRSVDVTIFHGDEDRLIPDEMGRSLAARDGSGDKVQYIPVPGAGHNDVVMRIAPDLLRIIAE